MEWKAYNRLIKSVPEVRERVRLRFWQERLLQQASQTGVVLSSAEEFLRVFDGADPLSVPAEPWTRELFLDQIEAFPYVVFPFDKTHKTPTEWMAAAWEIASVRNELCWDMARTVSKLGELHYTKEYLRYLSQSLPIPRQVELFLYIRDRSPTREKEFRLSFENAFPNCVPHLPPSLTDEPLSETAGALEDEHSRLNLLTDEIPLGENDLEDEIPF